MKTVCWALEPLQLASYRDTLDNLETRFTNFWANVDYPVRMLAQTRRFSFGTIRQELRRKTGPLDDLRDLLPHLEAALHDPTTYGAVREQVARRQATLERAVATLPNAATVRAALHDIGAGDMDADTLSTVLDGCARAIWPWRWYTNYRRMFDVIEGRDPPLALDHYLVCWTDDNANADALRQTLQSTFLLPGVRATPLPALFEGRYGEEATYLQPLAPGQPYLTVLTGWDVRGVWDLQSLSALLLGDYELTLAIDVATLPRARAHRQTTSAHTVLREAVFGRYAVKDSRAERGYAAVDHAMNQLDAQNLHEVAYAILLQAPSLAALEEQAQAVRDLLGARLRLDRVAGAQAEYLRFFTEQPAREIRAPIVRRNTLSHGVAVKMTCAVRKTARTNGVLVGYDPHEAMPIFFHAWGTTGVENSHMTMLGRPGSGKTVALLTLALRHAVDGAQIVFFDPIGKGQWLCDAVGGGARSYDVATNAAINILDPLSAEIGRQVEHVARKLAIVLGRAVDDGGRMRFVPRDLTNFELGALDRALREPGLYGTRGERLRTLTAATAPLLEDLVAALHTIADTHALPEAQALAREIDLRVLGSRAAIFNAHTQLHWDFGADVVAYNFRDADPALLPLLYSHGFEALNRWVRSPVRAARQQPLIAIIDEFFYMASVRSLESYVALATKTWRNYSAAMWTADQNATTYFGQEGLPSEWGPFTANNTLLKFFFRQEGSEADVLGRAYGDHLAPEHIQQIKTSGTGECVALLGDEVHQLTIQLTDQESAFFLR